MPATLKRALADSFALDHPDVPWQFPATLPSVRDLREGIEILTEATARCSRKHAAFCLAKLSIAFESGTKLSADDARMRVEIWLEACGDVPDDLWSKATIATIQTSKWMPKPAEFRAQVEAELDARNKQLMRCRAMLDKSGQAPVVGEFQRDPEDVRLRTIRDSWRRLGNLPRAAKAERDLAKLEDREVEDWVNALPEPEPVQAPIDKPASPSFLAQQAKTRDRLAKLARGSRAKQGFKPEPETLGDMLDDMPEAPPVGDYGHLATG